MLLSYNWIKEYLDPGLSPEDLAKELTLMGLEVVHIKEVNKPITGLKIGEVTKKWKHPNADRLNLTKIRYIHEGTERIDQVVCGASNIDAGQKIILATVGTELAPDFVIKKAKIRGEESCGMVCSKAELGKEEKSEGIWVLPPETSLSTCPQDLLGKPDVIFDFDLTSNRSDANSVLGIVREVAILKRATDTAEPLGELAYRTKGSWATNEKEFLQLAPFEQLSSNEVLAKLGYKIIIENPADCYRYQGVMVEGLQVGESPVWLQERLHLHGLRPINNMVDITNLILREYGQPIHAFDADKIGKHISTRRAKVGETLTILNGTTLKLTPDDLVIADENHPIAMAGVMGGLETGVSEATQRIFLEVAIFDPRQIRTTLKRHQLSSDAGKYYQNRVNPNFAGEVLQIAAQAMALLGKGKIISQPLDEYPKQVDFPTQENKTISLSLEQLKQTLGFDIPVSKIENIFKQLQFGVKQEKAKNKECSNLTVTVPDYRLDVNYEWDLIEEVARVYGYNNIPESFPRITNAFGPIHKSLELKHDEVVKELRQFCLGLGLHEILTYPFIENAFAIHLGTAEEDYLRPLNPVWNDSSLLRKNLMFGFMKTIAHNLEQKVLGFDRVFEIGKVFVPAPGFAEADHRAHPSKYEHQRLGIALWEGEQDGHWKYRPPIVNYSDLSGAIEAVLAKLLKLPVGKKKLTFTTQKTDISEKSMADSTVIFKGESFFLESTLTEVSYNNQQLAQFGVVSPKMKEYFGIKGANVDRRVLYGEIALEKVLPLLNFSPVQFKAFSVYPGVKRDIALVVEKDAPILEIQKTMESLSPLVSSIQVSDIYTGTGASVLSGKRSVVFSLEFIAPNKTLQRQEVDEEVLKMVEQLKKRYQFTLR